MTIDDLGVLQQDEPRLRKRGALVDDLGEPGFLAARERLHQVLAGFRARHGFGRAIAAPQIGTPLRLIALDLSEGPRALVNPRITGRIEEAFTLWDDGLSFPDLLVPRHRRITVAFTNERGAKETWCDLDPATFGLLQHEIDHLDGVLALDRAINDEAIVTREELERDPERFRARSNPT